MTVVKIDTWTRKCTEAKCFFEPDVCSSTKKESTQGRHIDKQTFKQTWMWDSDAIWNNEQCPFQLGRFTGCDRLSLSLDTRPTFCSLDHPPGVDFQRIIIFPGLIRHQKGCGCALLLRIAEVTGPMLPVAIYSEILEGAKREIQVYVCVCVCVRIIAMIIIIITITTIY